MNSSSKTPSTNPLTAASRRRASSAARLAEAPTPHQSPESNDSREQSPDGRPRQSFMPLVLVALAILLAGVSWFAYLAGWFAMDASTTGGPTSTAIPAQYNGERAMQYLVELCDIGPRPSASKGMKRQQAYLTKFLTEQGASVEMQSFDTRHPEDGSAVSMSNLIATWYPTRVKRFLFCAHYDTRPFPDRDRANRRGKFVGANDGASGTAALMELSHQFIDLPEDVGVDIVLFDGEEFIFQDGRDDYFLGSTYFAQQYLAKPPVNPYQAGILLDMVGDRELKIYLEQNSVRFARELARSVWKTAEDLGVTAFVSRTRHELRDDHLPLNQIARIPTIDIIDFDYPRPGLGAPSYWHTEQDTPANCSGESLAAVVWVVHTWLMNQSGLR